MKRKDLNLNEFRKYINSKKVICYGCGTVGIRAVNILDNWGKANDITAFVDSDKSKWNKRLSFENYSFPIVSIDDAVKTVDQNTVFLITCGMDILEIRESLNQHKELDEIECFSLVEIAQQQLLYSDYPEILHESSEIMIPKKLHYCWLGGDKPIFIQNLVNSWAQICPDYEIIEWNETNYDFTKNRYMKEAFDAKDWGFVPDYARLDIVYNHGGIYLDTDVKILRKPDDLLYQKNFFISDCSFQVALGNGFGARRGDPIVKELMDYYDTVSFKLKDGSLNKLSSPIHQYNVLKKYGMEINDQFQTVHGANIYPMIMSGTCVHTMQMRKSEKSFFAHFGTTTWMGNKVLESRKKIRDFIHYEGLENYDINLQ